MDAAHTPLISVIVPVYNVEEWVGECLASIAAQTFTDFECIVVDDGSTDGSPLIVDEFAETDGRFRVVHQANRGLSGARNAGIELARGEYLLFVDSDDRLNPMMLDTMLETAVRREAKIVMCDCNQFGEPDLMDEWFHANGAASIPMNLLEGMPEDYLSDEKYWIASVEWRTFTVVAAWNKLWHRSVFEQARFPEGVLFEDRSFVLEAVPGNGPIALVHAPLYDYRQRRGSITANGMSPEARMRLCEEYLDFDSYLASEGWTDARLAFLRIVCKYLQVLYDNPEGVSPEVWRRYDSARLRAIGKSRELLPHLVVRPHLAIRIFSYAVDERLRSVLEKLWYRTFGRKLLRK